MIQRLPHSGWITFLRFIFFVLRSVLIATVIHWVLVIVPMHYQAFTIESAWAGTQGIVVSATIGVIINILLTYLPLFITENDAKLKNVLKWTDTEVQFVALLIIFFHHLKLSPNITQFIVILDQNVNTIIRATITIITSLVLTLNINSVLLLTLTFILAWLMTRLGTIIATIPTTIRVKPQQKQQSQQQAQQQAQQAQGEKKE